MRKTIPIYSFILVLMPLVLLAQPYPKESYKLDEEKKTLLSWSGEETTIDLSQDPAFATVETIGEKAFRANRELESVVLPSACKQIASEAFADCNRLKSISWGESLESIGKEAFLACKSLQSIDFKKVQSIEGSAFSGCAKLTSIQLPKTLEQLGEYAFYNCRQLENIEVEEGNEVYFSVGGVLYSHLLESWYLEQYPRAKKSEEYTIPYMVIGSASRALDNCKNIKQLYITGDLSRFNSNAFFNCTGLEAIYCYRTFPPEVLGEDAFYGVNVSECKLYVPQEAIEQYRSATGWQQFSNILPLPEEEGISRASYIYDHNTHTLLSYIGTEETLDMTKDPVLSKTVYIADDAMGSGKLANLTLRKLVLADGVKEIGSGSIWATEITSLKLNSKLEVMHEACISGAKITELVLPASLKEFHPIAIFNAFYLSQLSFDGENEKYEIREGLLIEKASNSLVFMPNGWHGGKNVTLPAGISKVTRKALYNDIFVEQIIFGEGLQEMGVSALSQCHSLRYVDLPSTVTTLQNNAFKGNNVLQTVIIRATTPPEATPKNSIGSYRTEGTFDQLPADAILYVPKESIAAYEANTVYTDTFKQIKPLEEAPTPAGCEAIVPTVVEIAVQDASLYVEAKGSISIYNLTGDLLANGNNSLQFEGRTGDVLLVVVNDGVSLTVKKVILE